MTTIMAHAEANVAGTASESWEDLPHRPSAIAVPVLAVAGFEGPLDWLLEMARAQRIDLAMLSIVELVDAFVAALDAALAERAFRADLSRWGEWLVMAATLVFAHGGLADAAARSGRTTDITDLFRACLVALRVPDQVDAYRLRFRELWRVPDAMARITQLLAARPEGGVLESFLPKVDGVGVDGELRCRAAVASTFLAGLELGRCGAASIDQETAWQNLVLTSRC